MTEVIHRPAGALAVTQTQTDWTPDQRAALDAMGIDDTATGGDLKVFLTYSQRTGLDPFARQIYMIGRNAKVLVNGQWQWRKRYTIQVGIDGFRVIAQRSGEYVGQGAAQWCGPDGQWRDVWLEDGPPAAARVTVHRYGFTEPLVAVALFREYAPTDNDGKPLGLWGTMPAGQIAKCAEALALRKAFPNDLSGIYVAEEMDQAGANRLESRVPRTLSELTADLEALDTVDGVRALWREARDSGLLDEPTVDTATGEVLGTLRERLTVIGAQLEPVVVEAESSADEAATDAE